MNFQSLNMNINRMKKKKDFLNPSAKWADNCAWSSSHWRTRPALAQQTGSHGLACAA
jgi:hypothetical protein